MKKRIWEIRQQSNATFNSLKITIHKHDDEVEQQAQIDWYVLILIVKIL